MTATRRFPTALTAALLLLSTVAMADDVQLVNGKTIEGKARRVGDEVIVETSAGELRLPADEVREIVPGKTRADRYQERAKALPKDDAEGAADAHAALADWCKEQKLSVQARRHWKRAVEIDPDHRGAHAGLGHVRYESRWLTQTEYYEARGFVRSKGAWVHRDELARRTAIAARDKALREHVKTIRDSVTKMSSHKRKTRLVGRVALQEYAEGRGDLELAAFATRVAEHYNAAWRVQRIRQRATALTEIRATHSQLKRPIPTIQTSLGANSTPVTIQLPELAIAQIKTTVRVPLNIELDEDE